MTAEQILVLIGIVGGILGLVKANKDYQDRKLKETTIKERESSVGETAVNKITKELRRLEDKIDDVDNHCEERDEQQRKNVNNFFEQTWKLLKNQ